MKKETWYCDLCHNPITGSKEGELPRVTAELRIHTDAAGGTSADSLSIDICRKCAGSYLSRILSGWRHYWLYIITSKKRSIQV